MGRMDLRIWTKCVCGKPLLTLDGTSLAEAKRIRDSKKPVTRKCLLCGRRVRRLVTDDAIKEAVERFKHEQKYLASLAPAKTTDGSHRIRSAATFEGPRVARRVRGDQVAGAAKLYHYAVYVRHPWGTDRIVVGIKKQNVQAARDEAWDRVGRHRRTGNLKIMDCVPMKWTDTGLVEVKRKTTIKKGNLKQTRRPKSRPSVRENKRKATGR